MKLLKSHCFLKFKSFNVEGLHNKLNDNNFVHSLSKYDFITLVETWLPEKSTVKIPGYYVFNKHRLKSKKEKRHSGGISVLIRKPYRKGVENFSSDSDIFVWWKLDKSFFNLEMNIYV